MDHVKKARGRQPKPLMATEPELPEDFKPNVETKRLRYSWAIGTRRLRLKDQREYVILEQHGEGWLVAEMNPNFGKMGDVHFWRNEFIEEIRRRNYIIPERRKK